MIVIMLLDVIGILAFAGSAYFAYQNYERLKEASRLWFYYMSASLCAALWAASDLLSNWFEMAKTTGEPALFFATIFLFTLVSMGSLFDFIKLHGRY